MGSADSERLANDQVEHMLDLYAEGRLTPSSPTLARIRANVVADARAASEAQRATTAPLLSPSFGPVRPRFAWLQAPLPRRGIALGMAATLTLGTTAAVIAAPPGSPFYNARLVLETAFLPPVANIDARLAAYEDHFEARLSEAEAALARGDPAALEAALAAYQAEVANAVAEVEVGNDKLAHLEAVLARHIAKLNELAERLPTEVARQNAVDHAIAASERAVEKIREKQSNRNQGGGNGNGNPGGNGNAGGNGNENAGGNGNQSGSGRGPGEPGAAPGGAAPKSGNARGAR